MTDRDKLFNIAADNTPSTVAQWLIEEVERQAKLKVIDDFLPCLHHMVDNDKPVRLALSMVESEKRRLEEGKL